MTVSCGLSVRGMAVADIHGVCEEPFEAVRGALARNLDAGEELGASLVVDIDGEIVIDMCGGFRDEGRTIPRSHDTITNVWSSTKTVTSLAALMLADRGELDVDAPVARYWPEFAANGKQDIDVRHPRATRPPTGPNLLAHSSGVSGAEPPGVFGAISDWATSSTRYAAQAPWWEI